MALPLEKYKILQSNDLDVVREHISRSYCRHSLTLKRSNRSLLTSYHRFSIGGVSFNFLQYGADVIINPGAFERFFMVEIPLSGTANIRYGCDNVVSKGKVGVVISPIKAVLSNWSTDAKRLMVQIDRKTIEQFTSIMLGHPLSKPLEFALPMDVSTGMNSVLCDYVYHIINQIDKNHCLIESLLVKKQVQQTLMCMLLDGQPNSYSAQIQAVATPGAPRYIQRVYDYIEEHFSENIGIDDLVRVSSVSGRSLFAGFKRYKGVSPMEAIRALRLQAVRRDLISSQNGATVTTVASKWGFTHLGRFAKYYEKMFGEKPSYTIRKNRY